MLGVLVVVLLAAVFTLNMGGVKNDLSSMQNKSLHISKLGLCTLFLAYTVLLRKGGVRHDGRNRSPS